MAFRVSKIQRKNWKSNYRGDWNTSYKKDKEALGSVCSHCGKAGTKENPLQRHHVIPKAKGGIDARINLRLLCKRCHSREHPRQNF